MVSKGLKKYGVLFSRSSPVEDILSLCHASRRVEGGNTGFPSLITEEESGLQNLSDESSYTPFTLVGSCFL